MTAALILYSNNGLFIRKSGKLSDGFIEIKFSDIPQHSILLTFGTIHVVSTAMQAYVEAEKLLITRDNKMIETLIIILKHETGYTAQVIVYSRE